MMTAQLKAPLEAYYTALVEDGDFSRVSFTEDFRMHAPGYNPHTAREFTESVSRLHRLMERIDVRRQFTDGQEHCVIYDCYLYGSPDTPVRMMEWITLEGEKLARIHLIFDTASWGQLVPIAQQTQNLN